MHETRYDFALVFIFAVMFVHLINVFTNFEIVIRYCRGGLVLDLRVHTNVSPPKFCSSIP